VFRHKRILRNEIVKFYAYLDPPSRPYGDSVLFILDVLASKRRYIKRARQSFTFQRPRRIPNTPLRIENVTFFLFWNSLLRLRQSRPPVLYRPPGIDHIEDFVARSAAPLVRFGKVVKLSLTLQLIVVTNTIQKMGYVFISIPKNKNLFPKLPHLTRVKLFEGKR